jgi:small multidrug resistance pump
MEIKMYWFYLILAILFEVAGTTSMKLAHGFTKPLPSAAIFIFYGISFSFITLALKKLDISMAYAIWAGAGTVLITIIGIYWFNEPKGLLKSVSILLIILGVIGLKISHPS